MASGEIALWKYFKQEIKTPLPSSTGSLSKAISTDRIVAANKVPLDHQRVLKSITHLEKIVAVCSSSIFKFSLLTRNLENFSTKFFLLIKTLRIHEILYPRK